MRPISEETRVILNVHSNERTFELPPKIEARRVITVYDVNSLDPVVHCSDIELAHATVKFLRQFKFEIRDGMPLFIDGAMYTSSKGHNSLAGAEFGVRTTLVESDELIARNVYEAIYILGYSLAS